jgi:DNA-binding NtrC family response regulator
MKLLRVLQSGEFERLGSNTTRKVDVRLITATNANLEAAIAAGEFRQDLFFRLNVIEIALPGLAARREDVLPLARHFLAAFSPDPARPAWKLSPESVELLEAYHWPGNVRELQNKIQRATLVAPSHDIEPSHLGLKLDEISPKPKALASNTVSSDDAEEHAEVRAALDANKQVISRAAAALGISRQALYRKMNRLGIAVEKLTRT